MTRKSTCAATFACLLTIALAGCATKTIETPSQLPPIGNGQALRAAAPEALIAYREGMAQLKQPLYPDTHDYKAIEQLFDKAAKLGLPHAYYGLACTIYASGAKDRWSEAYEFARYAAEQNVLEARALLINYEYDGVGVTAVHDLHIARRELDDLYQRATVPGVISGAPGTVDIHSQSDARAIVNDAILSRTCGPSYFEHGNYLIANRYRYPVPIKQVTVAPAKPEAVALFREGMEMIRRPMKYIDFGKAEAAFTKAAALGLPHGRYGMACLIYKAGWVDRKNEMLKHATYAADHNVLEAKALLVWFHNSIAPNRVKFQDGWTEVTEILSHPDFVSGAPGTVQFADVDQAMQIAFAIGGSGECW